MVSAYSRWTTSPHELPPGNYPLTFSHKQLTSEQMPPMKFPQGNYPLDLCPGRQLLLNSLPLSSYRHEVPHRAVAPGLLHLKHLSLNNSSLNKWQLTFALENYSWIIYRCRSKRVLFAHFSSEISNKFWKKISKSLCILLCGDILLRGNPFFKWIKRKY